MALPDPDDTDAILDAFLRAQEQVDRARAKREPDGPSLTSWLRAPPSFHFRMLRITEELRLQLAADTTPRLQLPDTGHIQTTIGHRWLPDARVNRHLRVCLTCNDLLQVTRTSTHLVGVCNACQPPRVYLLGTIR